MRLLVLIVGVFSVSQAKEVFDLNNLGTRNLTFELNKEWVQDLVDRNENVRSGVIVARINEFADRLFKNIEIYAVANSLDPFSLSDVEDEFLASSITLTEGQLKGISTIERYEDVTVSYSTDNRKLEIYIPIEFSNLNFTYDYHVIVLLIGPKGTMVGKIDNFRMSVLLEFDLNTYQSQVLHVHTTNSGFVSVTFHGNGIVDLVVNILSQFTTIILQPLIAAVIHGVVSDVADNVVNTINNAISNIFPAP